MSSRKGRNGSWLGWICRRRSSTPGLWIQSASAEAAAALNAELPRLLQTLGQLPIVQSSVPKFAEFAGELRPTVAGDRLTLQRSSVTALASLLTPPLEIGRLQTARAGSMNNLKQIMLAMFNISMRAKPALPAANLVFGRWQAALELARAFASLLGSKRIVQGISVSTSPGIASTTAS